MAYEMTDEERQEYDVVIEETIDENEKNPSRLMQLATDATRFLSVASDTVEQVKETGFFQRLRDLLPSSRRNQQINGLQESMNSLSVSQQEIREMQNLSWRMIEQLNERNLLTADALITVKNNLKSLAVEQNEVKAAIEMMANKVADRFEKLENRVANVESSQNLQLWIANLEDDDYEKLPVTIRFLKVVKGFYLKKQENYTIDEIKSLRRALRNVGLDPKQNISLGKLLDSLIEELQNFPQDTYVDITKVELSDGKTLSGKELSKLLAVPSFVTICELPESKLLLQDAVDELKDDLGIPYEKALQRVIKRRISRKNRIDLDKEESLFDLGVELISCYSAIPKLYEQKTSLNTKTLPNKTEEKLNPETLDLEHLEKYTLTALVHLSYDLDTFDGAGKIIGDYIDKFDISDFLQEEERSHDASLQKYIATLYEFGLNGAEEDSRKYKYWLEKSADQGYVEALYWLGNHLLGNVSFVGEGVFEKDVSKGLKILTEIVESKNPRYLGDAATDLGHYYLRESNEKEAFKYYTIGANNNDSAGCLHLGFMYRDGEAVEPDEEKAFRLFKKAADLGNYYGKLQMAYCYEDGTGTEPDEEKAMELYEEILENCDDDLKGIAAYHLGKIYRNNEEYDKAISYFKTAAEFKNADSYFYLGMAYQFGEGCLEDGKKAIYWYKKAIENNVVKGICFNQIAKCYEYGCKGIEEDLKEAFDFYLKAAEEGDSSAQNRIGLFYDRGDIVQKSSYEAFRWFEKAAENGNTSGKYNLGLCYWLGDGCQENKEKGYQLIKQAAKEDCETAQDWLRENGYGA